MVLIEVKVMDVEIRGRYFSPWYNVSVDSWYRGYGEGVRLELLLCLFYIVKNYEVSCV